MIDSNPRPSRQLHLLARLARWSLGLLLAFWLLLSAVAWVLHGFIVPRIGEWRPHIERLATNAMGLPVRMQAITARSEGLFPTLHLQGLTLHDAQGLQALRLENITVTVSARSLLRLGIEQLYIDAPHLEIRRLRQGLWQVAGLTLAPQGDSGDHRALEWLLQQPELVVRNGQVLFTDDLQGGATTGLQQVDITMRHRPWSHSFRIDARPTVDPNEQLQVQGVFRTPLLPSRRPAWERWHGQWYASAQIQALPALPWPQAWQMSALTGQGQARLWLDVDDGQPQALTADVALERLELQWQSTDRPALAATDIQGRLQAQWQAKQWQAQAQNFQFTHSSGAVWPASDWRLQQQPRHTQLQLDYADIAVARQIAQALPLPAAWHTALTQLQPSGILRQLQLRWTPEGSYQARGALEKLSLAAQAKDTGIGTPGVQGLDATFELSDSGGQAHLALRQGQLIFPGIFEEAALPMDILQGTVRWHVQAQQLQVEVPQLDFSNADATGQLSAHWRTGQTPQTRFPGHLDLQGVLERANGARVFRYLPLSIPASARNYVRSSVLQGEGENVEFAVRGHLQHMPFADPSTGRFWIKAPLRQVVYNFVPPTLQPTGQAPWQTLTALQGDLIFDGASMRVEQASSKVQDRPDLHLQQIDASIAQLNHPTLALQAQGRGPLAQWLQVVQSSPLSSFTGHALDTAQAQGSAELDFALQLPIHHPQQAQVDGAVRFQNNGFQLSPEVPLLQQLQGQLRFSEHGFALERVQAQALGGTVQLQGGMASPQEGVYVHAQGKTTAAALQTDTSLPVAPWVAHHASGQASYAVVVTARNGARSITVQSDLRDLALHLPAPLDKPAGQPLPLEVRFTQAADSQQDIQVQVGDLAHVQYLRDASGPQARVTGGRIDVGVPTDFDGPIHGVRAQLHSPTLDLDAWLDAWARSPKTDPAQGVSPAALEYLPQSIALDVQALRLQQRNLGALQAQLQQRHGHWSAQLQSPHLAGQLQYHPPSTQYLSGQIYARLSHLLVPESQVQRLQTTPSSASYRPDSLPALDIQVDRLEIAGKALGQLHLQAHNRIGRHGREWLLERFDLQTPEAHWQANGYWGAQASDTPAMTHLGFSLSMDNAGQLLDRMGMPNVIRQAAGRLGGQIAWAGSPITPDWSSMDGSVQLKMHKGQFLKAEPGMGKLLSVLSLQSLPRRFSLDFRDVFSQGFAFDTIEGDVRITQGVATTDNLQMQGLNAAVWMEGQASLIDETQQLKVVVIPEINAMTASLAATAINPVVGVGSFVAQWLLRAPLMEAATRSFYIHGSWSDPVVEPLRKNTPVSVIP